MKTTLGNKTFHSKLAAEIDGKNEGFPKGIFFFRVPTETQQRPNLAREYVPTWNQFLDRQLKTVAFAWVLITEQQLGVAPRVLHCKWQESSF